MPTLSHSIMPSSLQIPLRLLLLFFLSISASAASSSISDAVVGHQFGNERRLLQVKKPCPVNFESQNYTVLTSQCKGPDYPAEPCCSGLKDFACPFADQINDLTTECSTVMFSYITRVGQYPTGLFASICREGKDGLQCPALPPLSTPNAATRMVGRGVFMVMPLLLFPLQFVRYAARLLFLLRRRFSPQHHHDTTAFYDQIRSKFQLDFNKNQLVEKLRRLKKKYRNVIGKFGTGKEYTFKSPHEQATFEISSKIWGNVAVNGASAYRALPAPIDEDDDGINNPNFNNFVDCQSPNPNGIDINTKTPRSRKRNRAGAVKLEEKQLNTPNINMSNAQPVSAVAPPVAAPVIGVGIRGSLSSVIEETVKSCLSPIFKELLCNSMSPNVNTNGSCCGNGLGLGRSPIPLCLGAAIAGDKVSSERWRKQQILELEVFSKRLELVQDQISEQLQELRSMGN